MFNPYKKLKSKSLVESRSTRIPRKQKHQNKKQRKNHLDNKKQRKEIISKLRSNWESSTKSKGLFK